MITKPTLTQNALWAGAAYLAFSLLVPLVSLPAHLGRVTVAALVAVPTALFMLLQLWLSRALVDLKLGAWAVTLAMAVSLVVWLVARYFLPPFPRDPGLWLPLLMGLSIIFGFTGFGILLSRIVREPNVLLPVALVAMPVDYLGAMTPQGFTQNMVRQNPHLVQTLSVSVPAIGGAHRGLPSLAFIGPGDILFMAFFLAIVLRLDLNRHGTFGWMYGLLTVTMLIVLFTGINIAALIPMGLAVLVANWRYFRLKREEVFATFYAVLLVVALAAAFYAFSHAHFFRQS